MEYASPKYSGEPSVHSLANGLATLGRYGDSYMVHAAEGETVVPKEVFDANPELKDQLLWQMRMMGIQHPERYVVGSTFNSINPVTGQPEFFFKKIFKAVKKVFKKVLPIAAPIIGNIIAPGIGGPIASVLASKLSGGSWGDALQNAALTFGAQALGSGIMGASAAGEGGRMAGFFGGLQKGAMAPFQAAGNLFASGRANPLQQGIFGSQPTGFFPQYQNIGQGTQAGGGGSPYIPPRGTQFVEGPGSVGEAPFARTSTQQPSPSITHTGGDMAIAESVYPSVAAQTSSSTGGIWDRMTNALTSEKALGSIASFGLPALAVYALTPAQEEDLRNRPEGDPQRTAYETYEMLSDEEKGSEEGQSLLAQAGISRQYTPTQLASATGIGQPAAERFAQRFGPIGVQGGGIISGPNPTNYDNIPALLTDGEFVMTKEAVEGAGGGNRDVGAARMYNLMSQFERAV